MCIRDSMGGPEAFFSGRLRGQPRLGVRPRQAIAGPESVHLDRRVDVHHDHQVEGRRLSGLDEQRDDVDDDLSLIHI